MYDRWFNIKKVSIKPNTIWTYNNNYELHVRNTIGKLKIKDIRKSDIKEFFVNQSKLFSLSTIGGIHTVLIQVFQMAVDDEYIRINPVHKTLSCVSRGYTSKKMLALTLDEQKEFEWYLKNDRSNFLFCPIFYTMLWTGLRVGELISLRWCDIDFENNIIHVTHSATYTKNLDTGKMERHIDIPKTKGSVRDVPMLPEVKEMILLEKKNLEDVGITCKSNIDGYTDFIFLNINGEMFGPKNLYSVLQRIVDSHNQIEDRLKLPKFGNHTLRHTFATRLFDAGVDVKTVQTILGHSDFGITMNVYTNVSQEHCDKEFNKVRVFFP